MSERTRPIVFDLTLMFLTLAFCTILGIFIRPVVTIHRINIAMVFALGVVVVAAHRRTMVGFAMPLVSMAAFLFIFVPHEYPATDYVIAVFVLLVIFFMISGMANRIRRQGKEASKAATEIEKEKLRNTLLSSVSHDLRTPLTAIAGAASSLMAPEPMEEGVCRELAASIYRESQRLNRLVHNLLDMTRVESGAIKLRKEWHSIEEIVGAALSKLDRQLSAHTLTTSIPYDLPLVILDDILIEQVLVNLLDNASRYVVEGKAIKIWAKKETDHIVVGVDSAGVALGQEELCKLFEKFYRGTNVGSTHGAGLGLTICKAIVEMHGGHMRAEQLAKALSFQFTLPTNTACPTVETEETGNNSA
jgi:two-component system sensor histidine kinase KdpD